MENKDYCNDVVATVNIETTDGLGHTFDVTPADAENQMIGGKTPPTDKDRASEMDADIDVGKNKSTLPRVDPKQEAEEAIRLYNEHRGLTPLEIAISLSKKPELDVRDSKKVSHATKAKTKRITTALYKARTKGRLTAEAPQYDTCYLSELKDTLHASNNGFEPDTPVKIEFRASTTDGPIDTFIVSRL